MSLKSSLIIALLIVEGHSLFGGGGGDKDCPWSDCRTNYDNEVDGALAPIVVCFSVVTARTCVEDAREGCDNIDFSLIAFNTLLTNTFEDNNCSNYVNPTPSTTSDNLSIATPSPSVLPISCEPELNYSHLTQVREPTPPITVPTESLNNVLCAQHYYPTLRHCSIFSYSHLRPFHVEDIQTCSLPGSWYLLKHPDVTIEVTGVTDDIQSTFTRIEKINITMHSFECTNGATISYVATANDKLPSTLTSDDDLKLKLLDPVDFHVDQNHTVASILAPWLNLTVVVRKYDNNLGVVLRIPADIGDDTDGLCSAQCPSHAVKDIKKFESEKCSHDVNSAFLACAVNADLISALSGASKDSLDLTVVFNDVCKFDVLRSLSYSVLSFLKAVARDFSRLPDVAPHIVPEPFGHKVIIPSEQTTTVSSFSTSTSSPVVKPSTTQIHVKSSANEVRPSSTHVPVSQMTDDSILPTNFKRPAELPSSGAVLSFNRLVLLFALLPFFLLYRIM